MADNKTVNGITVATDEIAGVDVQRIKVTWGIDGTATDVAAASPMPVSLSTAADSAGTLTDGRQTAATPGTAVALVGVSTPCKWVMVTALPTNTGLVWIGGSAVLGTLGSQKGTPLAARDGVTIPVDNANKVFIDALVGSEGVTFTVGT